MNRLPWLILLTNDSSWHRTVVQALEGIANVESLATAIEITARLADREGPFGPIVIDTAAVPDIEALKGLVRAWKGITLVAVAYSVPSWRDAVELLQVGAVDYLRKVENVDQIRSRVGKLIGESTFGLEGGLDE
jgi:DNA-binding response OmpR family regulator